MPHATADAFEISLLLLEAYSDATPKVVLDDAGRGLFTIPSTGH